MHFGFGDLPSKGIDTRQLIEIASELQAVCDSKRWQSCLIGGLAIQRWGESRLTRDVHISPLTGFGTESVYIEGASGSVPGTGDRSRGIRASKPGPLATKRRYWD